MSCITRSARAFSFASLAISSTVLAQYDAPLSDSDRNYLILTREQKTGLVIIASIACLSFAAVVSLSSFALYNLVRQWRSTSRNDAIAITPFAIYFLHLMFFDAVQAMGSILHFRWAAGPLVEGSYCTAQGMVKQFGDVGVSLTTLTISLSTFFLIVFELTSTSGFRLSIAGGALACIWLFLILIITIPFASYPRGESYYGISGLWCWIVPAHLKEGIGLEYGWFWATAALNIMVYIPVYFCLRGNLSGSMSRWEIWLAFRRRGAMAHKIGYEVKAGKTRYLWMAPHEGHMHMSQSRMHRAKIMLWYPAAYVVTILPLSIVRFVKFQHPHLHIPIGWTVLSSGIFACSGLINVCLFVFTGRRYGLAPPPESSSQHRHEAIVTSHSNNSQQFADWQSVNMLDRNSSRQTTLAGGAKSLPSTPTLLKESPTDSTGSISV